MSVIEQREPSRKKSATSEKMDVMNAVLFDRRIDPYTKSVFNALIWFRNADTGRCNPSDDTVAALLGFGHRNRVARARGKLKAYGYLKWTRSGRGSSYAFPHAGAGPILADVSRRLEVRREARKEQPRERSNVIPLRRRKA
jgi:Helix-turn-helix domain